MEAFTQEPSCIVEGGAFRFCPHSVRGKATIFKKEFGEFSICKAQSDAIPNQTNLKILPCRFKPI